MEPEWTLILWDIENVPIPTELRDANGIKALTVRLKDFFAKSRQKHLHCIKFACAWPDYRSQYADLLGNLTLLGDMEAIAYQWQGRPHKNHNADLMLIRAAQRFSHMMGNLSLKTEHLVVFITSDQDFAATITDLKARNFRVEVIYHAPIASSKPISIINTADQSYDWLPFLQEHLKMPLSLDPYDESVKQAGTGVLGSAATPNKWSQSHGGAPARASSSRVGNASAQPQTQAPAANQPRQVTPAPATAPQSLLVMLSGWASADGWSIEEQCKLLLSAYVSEEAAAAATVHPSNDLKSAVLDFSSLGSGSQQSATTAAMLLDSVNCRDFIVFAKIVSCSDAALIGKFNSLQSNSWASAPLDSKGPSPSVASGNQDPSLPGSSDPHARQGYHGLSKPSSCQPKHQNNRPRGPSTVNRQPGPGNTCPKHVAGRAKGTNQQNRSQELFGQQSASAAHKSTLPSSADNSNSNTDVRPSKNIPGKSMYSAADAGSIQNAKASSADKAVPADADQSDSDSSGDANEDAFTAAFGLGGGSNGFAGHAQWGFDSAIGEPVTFPPEQCEQLQVQWNQLQCVDEAEQAHSEHRWYSIIVGAEICKVDLLNMLLFNEEDNKEPAPHVWRN